MFKAVFSRLILESDISKTEAGKRVGVSPQVINNWITGKTEPDHAALLRVSAAFDVSIDRLLGNKRLADDSALTSVPIVDKISDGNPKDRPEFHNNNIILSADMARLYDFGYLVRDCSMEGAGILHLDIVFIQYDVPVEDGVIFLVVLDDREFLARVFVQDKYFLLKREGNGFKPILIDAKKTGNFRLVGRVTGLFRPDIHVYFDPDKGE